MAVSLGVVLADPRRIDDAIQLLRADVQAGGEAQLFLMDEAVCAASDPRVDALLEQGVDVALCAMDAEARGVAITDGGPLFGSQYDHGRLVREAARVVAMTRVAITDSRPVPGAVRTVRVRLTRDAQHPLTAQGLRTAVGYASCSLRVEVALEAPARALGEHVDHPATILRYLALLRSFGAVVGPQTTASVDVEVAW